MGLDDEPEVEVRPCDRQFDTLLDAVIWAGSQGIFTVHESCRVSTQPQPRKAFVMVEYVDTSVQPFPHVSMAGVFSSVSEVRKYLPSWAVEQTLTTSMIRMGWLAVFGATTGDDAFVCKPLVVDEPWGELAITQPAVKPLDTSR